MRSNHTRKHNSCDVLKEWAENNDSIMFLDGRAAPSQVTPCSVPAAEVWQSSMCSHHLSCSAEEAVSLAPPGSRRSDARRARPLGSDFRQ